jgi:hypothetical protein
MSIHVGSTLISSQSPIMTQGLPEMTLAKAKVWCHHNAHCGGFRYMGTANSVASDDIEFMGTSARVRSMEGATAYMKGVPGRTDPTLTTHFVNIRLDTGDGLCHSRDDVAMSSLIYCKDANGAWAKNGGPGAAGCYGESGGLLRAGHQWPTSTHLDFGWHLDKNADKLSTSDDVAFLNMVALRFKDVGIPKNADITSAKIEMFAGRVNLDGNPPHLKIGTEASNDAKCFSYAEMNSWHKGYKTTWMLDLPTMQSEVEWQPSGDCTAHPEHCVNKGQFFDTPDLSEIIQPLVDREDWTETSPMAFFVQPEKQDELKPNQVPSKCQDPKCVAGKCTYCDGAVDGMFRLSAYAWDSAGESRDPYKVPHLQISYTTGCHVKCTLAPVAGTSQVRMEVAHPFRSRGTYHCARDHAAAGGPGVEAALLDTCSCTCDRAQLAGLAAPVDANPNFTPLNTCAYTKIASGLLGTGCRDNVNLLLSSFAPTEDVCKHRCGDDSKCTGFEFVTVGANGAITKPTDGHNCRMYDAPGAVVYTQTAWESNCYTKGSCQSL